MTMYRFPDGFVWGAGTSAYQVEGSPLADGATPSIQHRYAHTPGNCHNGETADVSADHYHRWREDVVLMKEMGLKHYQYSISWPRVLPQGTGALNRKGLDFYDRLTDGLLEAGVNPVPIVHVWDLPGVLQDKGGWANRDSASWLAEFAAVVFDLIGDRATHWLTICEPMATAWGGYLSGILAPAMRDLHAAVRAAHHNLLAHGLAVQAFRASGATGEIGTSSSVSDVLPTTDREEDIAAAHRYNAFENDFFLDPVMLGSYPEEIIERFGDAWPEIPDGDMATISTPIDFLGITHYMTTIVGALDSPETTELQKRGGLVEATLADSPKPVSALLGVRAAASHGRETGLGWSYEPQGIANVLCRLRDRYNNPPIIVTENGAAFPDELTEHGRVEDSYRIEFISDFLIAAHGALQDGVDLRGWLVWSLLDSWEFWLGLSARFGLIHIDYETLKRTVKDSGHWYAGVMASNGFEVP